MSAIVEGRVYWTKLGKLTYKAKNGKTVTIKESTSKLVMLAVADSADDYGENSWNSFQTLADKTSIERRSVIRVARALIVNNFLRVAGMTKYGTNNFSVNLAKLGMPPKRRSTAGRPKTGDSGAETSDSGAKTSDPESPYPSFNPPNPPSNPVEKISFDEEQADLGWALLKGGKVTQKQLDKQKTMKQFEDMLEVQFKRFPLNWIAFDETAKENFRKFIKALPAGESLEQFVNWWMSDEKRVSAPPFTLGIIMQRWPQAFVNSHKAETSQAEPKPVETQFTRDMKDYVYTPRKTFAQMMDEKEQSEQLSSHDNAI